MFVENSPFGGLLEKKKHRVFSLFFLNSFIYFLVAEEIIARAADIDSETSNNEGSPSQATGSINSKSTYHCNSPRHPPDEERSKIESNTSKEKESKDNSSTERKLSTQKDTASVQNTPTKTLSKHEQEKTGTRSQVRTRARTRAKIMLSSK